MADGIRIVIGDDRATLLFLVNLGCIDHNPWMSRMGSLEHPDYVLIDLDPQECSYEKIVEAALVVRAKLDRAELESYPENHRRRRHAHLRSSGAALHLRAGAVACGSCCRTWSRMSGRICSPLRVRSPNAKRGRCISTGSRSREGKTISAPYVLRAYPGAPVATPLAWREVTPRLTPRAVPSGQRAGPVRPRGRFV